MVGTKWALGTREQRLKTINDGIQKWLASLTHEQKEERHRRNSRIAKEKWAKIPKAKRKEIGIKIHDALVAQKEIFSNLKKNWWKTATEEQKLEARRKMSESKRKWWRAMSDEERKAAVDKIHKKPRDRKAAREMLGAQT